MYNVIVKNIINKILSMMWVLIVIGSIGILSGYLIIIANGYQINWSARKIIQQGMIYLISTPKNVSVYVNNSLKGNKSPFKMSNLSEGRYDIKVTKDGYYDWNKTLSVLPGMVSEAENIVLFLKEPILSVMNQDELDSFNKLPSKILNTSLQIKNNSEIWIINQDPDQNVLVTRLSSPIKAVSYYSDKYHILFQIKNGIHIIDLDGSNNIKLVELFSEDPSIFIADDTGQYLYYKDKDEVKKIKIN